MNGGRTPLHSFNMNMNRRHFISELTVALTAAGVMTPNS